MDEYQISEMICSEGMGLCGPNTNLVEIGRRLVDEY